MTRATPNHALIDDISLTAEIDALTRDAREMIDCIDAAQMILVNPGSK